MRLLGLVVSALLGVPVVPVVALTPVADSDTETLTVSPSHGVWTAPFTITYTDTFGSMDPLRCVRPDATFFLDQVIIGPVAAVYSDGVCTATVRVTLPGPTGPYDVVHMYKPGPHLIKGPEGLASALSTTYTIDPSPSPTAKPSPTHTPASARTTSRPAPTSPAASPSGPAAAPSPAVELTTGAPSASVRAVAAALPTSSGDASSGTTPWVVAGASVLVLGGGVPLGLLVVRRRRAPTGPTLDADTLDA